MVGHFHCTTVLQWGQRAARGTTWVRSLCVLTPVLLPFMEQLLPVLIGLLIAIISALTALVERVRRDLGTNTDLTKEAKAAAGNQISDLVEKLAAERNLVQGLRAIVREREDRIAYLVARVPQADDLMLEYRDRRTRRATEADEAAAEMRITASERTRETPVKPS
jgi:hypothetical protein